MTVNIKDLKELQAYLEANFETFTIPPKSYWRDKDTYQMHDEEAEHFMSFDEALQEECDFENDVLKFKVIWVGRCPADADEYHYVYELTNKENGDTVEVGWLGWYSSWDATEIEGDFHTLKYATPQPVTCYSFSDKPA